MSNTRIGDTIRAGGFSLRFSRALGHKGRRGHSRVTAGHRTPVGWVSASTTAGERRKASGR